VLGEVPVIALSGPNIAVELARKLPATVTAACEDLKMAERVQEVFSTPWFRVYTNDDVVGVELAAAMKNVIAMAAGGLDAMGIGCNAKAALLTRGLAEIARLGLAMGAKRETFAGLSGLGDLLQTAGDRTIGVAGTFNAAALLGLQAGGADDRIANATERTAKGVEGLRQDVRNNRAAFT